MTINFELLKVRKMTSLKLYISVKEKLETSNLDIGKPDSEGSIESSA